jgi:hypothetical protein
MRNPLAHLAVRLCLIAADAALRALAAASSPAAASLAAWGPFPAFLEPREPPARTVSSPALPESASDATPPSRRLLPTAPAPEESDLAQAPPPSCGLADSLANEPEPLAPGNRTCTAPGPAGAGAGATAAAAPRPPPKDAAAAGGQRPASSIALRLLHARRLGAAGLAAGAAAAAWTCAAMLLGWGA